MFFKANHMRVCSARISQSAYRLLPRIRFFTDVGAHAGAGVDCGLCVHEFPAYCYLILTTLIYHACGSSHGPQSLYLAFEPNPIHGEIHS